MKLAWQTQERVALQARLDVCAVRMAAERRELLVRIARANQALRLTVAGIYAARGAKLATGPAGAVLGSASEAAFLRLNHALALAQDAELARAVAREALRSLCPADRFSRSLATCAPSPAAALALTREKALFPDVRGALVHRESKKNERLATFRCRGGNGLRTRLELRGDPKLVGGSFPDVYEE